MKHINRNPVIAAVFTGFLLSGAVFAAFAATQQTETFTSRAYLHSYNLPGSGIALEGYSPVSYFTADGPVKGKPEYASDYNGVTYLFPDDGSRRTFERNPEKYLPAYGGWCAFGMAIEDKFPVDPTAYKIVDGRLMLFLRNQNVDALALWNGNDEEEQVTKAESHWMKVSK